MIARGPSLGRSLAELMNRREVKMTATTAREMREKGIAVPEAAVVSPAQEKSGVLVCLPFDLAAGALDPDNLIGKCGHCQQPILFRKHASATDDKICLTCAGELP